MDFYQYNQYTMAQQMALDNERKTRELKERLSQFANIATLVEAKNLAKTILPTKQEITSFYSGNAKCIVINKDDMIRISFDTPEEFICYDFSE